MRHDDSGVRSERRREPGLGLLITPVLEQCDPIEDGGQYRAPVLGIGRPALRLLRGPPSGDGTRGRGAPPAFPGPVCEPREPAWQTGNLENRAGASAATRPGYG